MDIQYVYTKKRSEFGRQVHFTDRPVEVIADIQPNPELLHDYIARNPIEIGIQKCPRIFRALGNEIFSICFSRFRR